eukprot:365819-Chlamydomonas_euryale.AAC.13
MSRLLKPPPLPHRSPESTQSPAAPAPATAPQAMANNVDVPMSLAACPCRLVPQLLAACVAAATCNCYRMQHALLMCAAATCYRTTFADGATLRR